MKSKQSLEWRLNIDTNEWQSFDRFADEFGHESFEDWQVQLIDALRILGLHGEIVIIAAWDGDADEDADWVPQEIPQYIWNHDTDEGTDSVYVNNVLIADILYSRGTAEMTRHDKPEVWFNDGQTNGIWERNQ